MGELSVRVLKGTDLEIGDHYVMSSDPYVVVQLGKQRKKTAVKKRTLNPDWSNDQELKFTNVSYRHHCLLIVQVFDDDRFPKFKRKDFLGEAVIDIEPLIQESYPMATGKKVVVSTSNSYLAKDSWIIQHNDGRIVQDVSLKLAGVQSGLLEIRLEWQPGWPASVEVNQGFRSEMGVLYVRVLKETNLVIGDRFVKRSDPYVVVRLGEQKKRIRVRKRSLNSVWDEELKFTNVSYHDHCLLTVEVLDDDRFPKFKRKDFLGKALIDVVATGRKVVAQTSNNYPLLEESYPMEAGKKLVPQSSNAFLAKDSYIVQRNDGRIVQDVVLKLGRVQTGLLEIRLEWQPRWPASFEVNQGFRATMAELSGVLYVRVIKGTKLVIRDHFVMSSDPYVVIKLGEKKKTTVKQSTLNPFWDEELSFNIENISALDRCTLTAEVWDKDKFTRDDFMGSAEIDLKPLLQESYPVAAAKKVLPQSSNAVLDKDSYIAQRNDGRIVQDVLLNLGGVVYGLLYVRLEWHPWQPWQPGIIVSTGWELWITSKGYPLRCEAFRN